MTLRIVQLESESLVARGRRPAFAHDWIDFPKTGPAQVVERLAGTNNVDLDACRARGIVDEVALVRALREGWIAGAGFDLLATEPPPDDHPLLDPAFSALPNFLLTPHVAWASRPAMQPLADQLIDKIEAFAAGSPRNRVA